MKKKRPVDIALSLMRKCPDLNMRQVRARLVKRGVKAPSLSMLYRWRDMAGLNPKRCQLTGVLHPEERPGYLLSTSTGTHVRRAPFRLSDGRRIFLVENFNRGNTCTVQPSLPSFLDWLESYEGKPLTLFTRIDGELTIVS